MKIACAGTVRMHGMARAVDSVKRVKEKNDSWSMIFPGGKQTVVIKCAAPVKKSGHSFRSGLNISPLSGTNHLTAG